MALIKVVICHFPCDWAPAVSPCAFLASLALRLVAGQMGGERERRAPCTGPGNASVCFSEKLQLETPQ